MAINIEIKARINDLSQLKRRAERVSGNTGQLLRQEDTFFPTSQGRLKLRETPSQDNTFKGQLIYYERQDMAGPKRSDYFIARTPEPGTLKEVLTHAFGIRGIVRKNRWLYWVGNTRIHLDQVEDLGDFLELEVVLEPEQSIEEGQIIAASLMEQLGVSPTDLVEEAYMDLLDDVRNPTAQE